MGLREEAARNCLLPALPRVMRGVRRRLGGLRGLLLLLVVLLVVVLVLIVCGVVAGENPWPPPPAGSDHDDDDGRGDGGSPESRMARFCAKKDRSCSGGDGMVEAAASLS